MALVHPLPVATAHLLSFPLSSQRVEDLASGLQFNMCIKVIWGFCHQEGCSPRNRACFINSSSIKQGNPQVPKWTLSQGRQREIILSKRTEIQSGQWSLCLAWEKGGGILSALHSYFQWGRKSPCGRGWQIRLLWGFSQNQHPSPPRAGHILLFRNILIFLWDSFCLHYIYIYIKWMVVSSLCWCVGTEGIESCKLWWVHVSGERRWWLFGGIVVYNERRDYRVIRSENEAEACSRRSS